MCGVLVGMCAEHLEPEDMVLKAKVETLRKQVKDTAARAHAQRSSVPAEMKQQVHQSIQQAAAALTQGAGVSTGLLSSKISGGQIWWT